MYDERGKKGRGREKRDDAERVSGGMWDGEK
jgi:hypothetical protein